MSAVKKSSSSQNQQIPSKGIKESDLKKMEKISPDDVLRLDRVTEDYLCSPEANVYNLDFTRFKIRDMETGATLFEIAKPPNQAPMVSSVIFAFGIICTFLPRLCQIASLCF